MWSEQRAPLTSLAAIFIAFWNAVKVAMRGSSLDGEAVKDVRKNVYLRPSVYAFLSVSCPS